MSIFSNINKNFDSPFTTNIPNDLEYLKLSNLMPDQCYTLVSCYINSKSKFGAHGVATVIDSDEIMFNVSLPKHLNDVIETILSNDEYIDEINKHNCKFHVKECFSNKYNRKFNTIEFE